MLNVGYDSLSHLSQQNETSGRNVARHTPSSLLPVQRQDYCVEWRRSARAWRRTVHLQKTQLSLKTSLPASGNGLLASCSKDGERCRLVSTRSAGLLVQQLWQEPQFSVMTSAQCHLLHLHQVLRGRAGPRAFLTGRSWLVSEILCLENVQATQG